MLSLSRFTTPNPASVYVRLVNLISDVQMNHPNLIK